MTYPRAHLIDAENGGFYHLISRCVRRAWLCGEDPLTGRSFEHRRQWIEDRALELASCFTVELYGYAVMSNHYHLVLHIDPKAAVALPDHEAARRWISLCPPKASQRRGRPTLVSRSLPKHSRKTPTALPSAAAVWVTETFEAIAPTASRSEVCSSAERESLARAKRRQFHYRSRMAEV